MDEEKFRPETVQRRRVSEAVKRELLKRNDNRCAFCGLSGDVVPLQLARITPFARGDQDGIENFLLLCPNCHALLDNSPRQAEFVAFVSNLLEASGGFSDVRRDVIIGKKTLFPIDISCKEVGTDERKTLLFECSTSGVINERVIKFGVERLKRYAAIQPKAKLVYATPSTLMPEVKDFLHESGIELWDLSYIAARFAEQIGHTDSGYYNKLFSNFSRKDLERSEEDRLMKRLKRCQPGQNEWRVYQKTIGDILELLFTPALNKPLEELSDKTRTNRRDFIMPNDSEGGFWLFMRTAYQADYIVVDAKNYSRKVKKGEVLQIANYLKPHGAGLFGMILTRNGGDQSGCEHTLREQWLSHRKMILVLKDADVEQMLIAKRDGRSPESVIQEKIQQFRLSM